MRCSENSTDRRTPWAHTDQTSHTDNTFHYSFRKIPQSQCNLCQSPRSTSTVHVLCLSVPQYFQRDQTPVRLCDCLLCTRRASGVPAHARRARHRRSARRQALQYTTMASPACRSLGLRLALVPRAGSLTGSFGRRHSKRRDAEHRPQPRGVRSLIGGSPT